MKKILALALAVLMMAFALAACGEPENTGDTTTPNETEETTPNTDETTPAPDYFDDPSGIRFEQCNEKVYVDGTLGGLWLRTEPDFDNEDNKKSFAEYGEEMTRIGKHETWSKIVFEGEEYFASTKYLSTEKPAEFNFEKREETVYVNQGANYRSFPSLDDEYKVASFEEGTELIRTGILFDTENNPDGDLGWSRILYNDNIYFMRNSVLTVKEGDPENTPAEIVSAKDAYDAVRKYFDGVIDISISGNIISKAEVGTDSEENVVQALLNAKGLGNENFACYMSTNGTEIVYIDGYYYLSDTSNSKIKMLVDRAEIEALFSVDAFVSHAFDDFANASIEKKGDRTVLTLKGISEQMFFEDALGITRDLFKSDAEYEAFIADFECDFENYTETFTLDKSGKVTAFTLIYSYTQGIYKITESEENTVSESVADITAPADADSYVTLG